MAITEKNITLCGHGSGNPSTKNMYTYLSTRYNSIASNGKHKGVVKVMRLKAMTDSGRKKFHDTYKTILGRNIYNQSLRNYVYTKYNGKYYSDCSSSGCATYKKIGYDVPLLNTAGIYNSNLFKEVDVKISKGHITNPEVLKVGDALLFVGNDPSRPLQIGHVEYVYEIKGTVGNTTNKTESKTSTSTSKTSKAPTYKIGQTYTLQKELNVRVGAGKKYAVKVHGTLTTDGRKHDKDKDGALDKGTKVTCKAIKKVGNDIWMKTPSGWIAAYYNGSINVK